MNSAGTLETVEQLTRSINAGNADEVLLLCDDSIAVTEPDGGIVSGRDAFRSLLAKMIELHADLHLTGANVDGDTVTGIMVIANDYHRKVGIAPLELNWQAVVHEGKVYRFGGTFTDASLEKLRPLRERAV